MRIAVAADGPEGLDASVSHVFGRAPYVVLVEARGTEIEGASSHANPAARAASGAGPAAVQFVVSLGAEAVIAGDFGPNALAALTSMGIRPVPGYGGMKVRDAVKDFLEGGGAPTGPLPAPGRPPLGWPPSPLPPAGPTWPPSPGRAPPTPPGILSREEEIAYLRERKRWIEERLREIDERLRELGEEGGSGEG